MATKTMIQAITEGLDNALAKNDKVLLFGEDVGFSGGVFRATQGLQAKHGNKRVFDTPLAESAIGGLAIGLALEDFIPVMEIQFSGFFYEVLDSIMGQASRYSYRMNRTRVMPITIRAPYGGGVHTPEMHADSLEGMLAQSPGLRVVIPSNAYDAKGLLLAAIECEDPVVFLEHMKLYRSNKEEVPEEYYTIPIDKANVIQEGTDITIIAYGAMVKESKDAIIELEKQGYSVELIDLISIAPLDVETIINSVTKTGRVLIVQEAQQIAGIGASISALIAERCILSLKAPVNRLSSPNTTYPFGMIENEWLVSKKDILKEAQATLSYEY